MNSKCPACKMPLEISPELIGQRVACPLCKAEFLVSGSAHSHSGNRPPASLPAPLSTSVVETNTSSIVPMTRRRDRPVRLLDLFDLTFNRYVTPLIVKITWVLALLLAVVWLVTAGLFAVVAALPEKKAPSIEEKVSEAPRGRPAPMRQVPEDRSPPEYRFRSPTMDWLGEGVIIAAAFVTQIIGVVLLLLWVRVVLESIIVLFNIAASLKSIERNSQQR